MKACNYCAYQERTQQQVRDKLFNWSYPYDLIEEAIARLIQEGFINEERFAIAYARGKFRQNKWGKVKIKNGLSHHGLSDYCIKTALAEIDDDEYSEQLKHLAIRKLDSINDKNYLQRKKKLSNFLYSKGYEFDLINEAIRDLVAEGE